MTVYIFFFRNIPNENKPFTYPKLRHQDVSNAAQNCHTVKYIPGIFEIILLVRSEGKGGDGRAVGGVRERMVKLG